MMTFLLARSPWIGVLFAQGSLRSFFTGGSSRDRVIQLCVVCMALALLILMKKLAPDGHGSANRRRPPSDLS